MRQLVYAMFLSNNRPSFQLWWKENLLKHQKVSKYYETDCIFTYSPLGKAFETIEDKGQKQTDALESLKPKEQTKPIEDKSTNQTKASIIFNDLINKRKK